MDYRWKGFARLVSLHEARELILEKVQKLPYELVELKSCLGRVLAEDVRSSVDVPPFDRSAMDGYAVKASDTFGCSVVKPAELSLKGFVDVGARPPINIVEGEAAQIATGAMMPSGADAVVMVEYTKLSASKVYVYKPVTPGENVSRRGEDLREGDVVARAGRILRPEDLALMASCNITHIPVTRKPAVAIIPTGREIAPPGEAKPPETIPDANSYSLQALTKLYGGLAKLFNPIPSTVEEVKKALYESLEYDVTTFIGGSSVGEEDIVPYVISKEGLLLAHGLAIRPGKPTAIGVVKGKPVFSLPGFPVASMIAFEEVVCPVIQKLLGASIGSIRPLVKAKVSKAIPSEVGRRVYVRVKLEEVEGVLYATPIRTAGSGIISSMAKADGFTIIPEGKEGVNEGEEVPVYLLDARYLWTHP